jgi:hypothetical protein
VEQIDSMRREREWSAARIAFEPVTISRRTVTWVLGQLGLNRRRFIGPDGDSNRKPHGGG